MNPRISPDSRRLLVLYYAATIVFLMLETGVGFVTTPEIVNFVISGSIAWFSWQRGMTALFGPPR
jgi:hypothetical protein